MRLSEKRCGTDKESSSLAPVPQTQNDRKSSSKGKSLVRGLDDRAKKSPVEITRIRHDFWASSQMSTLQNTIGMQIRWKVQIQAQIVLIKNSKQLGCVFQDLKPLESKSILRKGPQYQGPKRSVQCSKSTSRRFKILERKGLFQGVIQNIVSHERSLIWQSAATDGECEHNTLTRHILSCLSAHMIMSHTTLAQVFVHVIPPMCHAPVCLISLRLSLRTLHLSLPSSASSS